MKARFRNCVDLDKLDYRNPKTSDSEAQREGNRQLLPITGIFAP